VDRGQLIAHVLALAPNATAHEVSAYFNELLHRVKRNQKEVTVHLEGASGKNAKIPENVTQVISVLVDGIVIPQTLDAKQFDYAGIDPALVVNDTPEPLSVGGRQTIIEEEINWGEDEYLTDHEDVLLSENGTNYLIA